MGKIDSLIQDIEMSRYYRGQMVKSVLIPATPARYTDANAAELSPAQKKYLEGLALKDLYVHQAQAVINHNNGLNSVLTTPTASGKSLAFNLPALSEIEKGRSCLYIYPAKALSNDQLLSIEKMNSLSGLNFISGVYDGDTDANTKQRLRREASVIITNPYELHQILPYHSKFADFYSRLGLIVLDEAHRYRGVFGSNIAFLIRRLLRICSYYGVKPAITAASGSIKNAAQFMNKLTGLPFTQINENGAPLAAKRIIFWDAAKNTEKSAVTQAKDLLLSCTRGDLQTLVFTKSRKMAESIRMWASQEDSSLDIASYRAGYTPELRREIENNLKTGKSKAIISTNALELGIDIGGLDSVIMAGYPGTVSSFWQQSGRAGRSGKESVIFFIPSEDAMEQYILKFPETVMTQSFESANVSLENPNITAGQVLCALAELPFPSEGEDNNTLFSDTGAGIIIPELEKQGVIKRTARGLIYSGGVRPHDAVSLDSSGPASIKLKVDGRILEELTLTRAYETAHKGAVHLYNGESYVITDLDLSQGEAAAEKKTADYVTEPVTEEEVKILDLKKKIDFEGFSLCYGDVNVTEFFKGYRRKKAGRTLGQENLELPPLTFNTQSVWFDFSPEITANISKQHFDPDGSMHAAEHAVIGMAPIIAMCDREDLGGRSYSTYVNGNPVIFVYDTFEGGIGISEKLFESFNDWLKLSLNNVSSCTCEKGCPACVFSPKCGNGNNPIDKSGSIEVLKILHKV
jgi:DEAD/DEAH box helicase domain-containing protein